MHACEDMTKTTVRQAWHMNSTGKDKQQPNGNGMAAETNATQRNAMQAKTLKHPQKRRHARQCI